MHTSSSTIIEGKCSISVLCLRRSIAIGYAYADLKQLALLAQLCSTVVDASAYLEEVDVSRTECH